MIKAICEKCGQKVECEPAAAGMNVKCPNCQGIIRLPGNLALSPPPIPKTWQERERDSQNRVVIADVSIPFSSMFVLFFKGFLCFLFFLVVYWAIDMACALHKTPTS
jgi:hypothetical protein